MIYTLKNSHITAKISDLGAELISVTSADGCEYMWQGNPASWDEHAPWLFPICGRLFESRYTYGGKAYEMGIHGFARQHPYQVAATTDNTLTMTLSASEKTQEAYPFDFSLSVTYRLSENRLSMHVSIENKDDKIMPFTFGAHPGFRVPINDVGSFEDHVLEFGADCSPDRILFSERFLINGKRVAYPLENARSIPLIRSKFTDGGLFLTNMADSVTLSSKVDPHFVTVKYPNTTYLGLWTFRNMPEPYLCIEPWNGMAGYDSVIEDLESKADMYHLLPDKSRNFELEYIFG